jgi:hypothetical protein
MAVHAAAYQYRVNKVTIHGTCFGGLEEWTTGFYLGETGADAADPGSATAAAIAPFWTTFFTGGNSKIGAAYKTDQIKVSQLEIDGDVDLDMIDIYDYPTPVTGTNGGAPQPPQITLAATLTSDLQRGLAAKGRMFLPGINLPVFNNDPRISPTEQGQITTGLKTFFDAVNASTSIAGSVILASKGRKTTPIQDPDNWFYVGGKNARVTGVRVGNVYDTQRRRRGEIPEVYTTAVLA